jgi:capsular polysaccharide biosynthesis protein
VNDPDQTVILPVVPDNGPASTGFPDTEFSASGLREQLWAYDDTPEPRENLADERPVDEVTGGFVNLGFIRAAIRRSLRFCIVAGLIGLIAGAVLYVKFPPAASASTSFFITNNPNQDAVSAMLTNVTLAESRPVAQAALDKLGLNQTPASFQAASTASVVTNQVLLLTANAPTTAEAIARAQALASAFLQFRAQMLNQQQQQVENALTAQVNKAQQSLDAINKQITTLSAQPATPERQNKLSVLDANRTKTENTVAAMRQTATDNQVSTQTTTATMIQGSQVLNAATAAHHSRLKGALEYVAGALLAGLAIGVGLVVIRAIVSDRLRRRDDVADVLGLPVRLSVGALSSRRWRPQLPGRANVRRREAQRLGAYLRNAVPRDTTSPAALAIVAVDNAAEVAPALVALARSYAREGKNVVLADMSPGAPAARLLGVKKSGVHDVASQDVKLTVAVGAPDDIAPVGPLRRGSRAPQLAQPSPELVAAAKSADYLLSLVTLDPALGGDWLPTWASDVVVTVTAGQSSATRILAVGDMVRLTEPKTATAVLVQADKSDETLGLPATRQQDLAGAGQKDGAS